MEGLETGIAELDLVLGGGIPRGSLVVLAGGPGTGKTILAQQICFGVATAERKAIYGRRSPGATRPRRSFYYCPAGAEREFERGAGMIRGPLAGRGHTLLVLLDHDVLARRRERGGR